MNDPRPSTPILSAPKPADPYRRADSLPATRGERPKVALVSADSQPTDGIKLLLRKRLGVIILLLGAVTTAAVPLFVPNLITKGFWLGIVFLAVLWLVEAIYAALLWGDRPLSLRALRTLEVFLFSMLMIGYAGYIYSPYRLKALLQYVGEKTPEGSMSALSAAVALPGFALLVIYGTFIPNTGRRCAVIVLGMALFPLLVVSIFGFGKLDIEHDLLGRFLAEVALLMAFGAAIAIYGSHRIDTLRQEAQEARQFGQYQLKRLLGVGGMGKVYLAEHLLLRRPCALKVIRAELLSDPDAPARFEREVRAMAALTHPNTVEIFDYGRTAEGTFYYVMEYLPGLSLEELVQRRGPLEPERAIHLLRQVCFALEEAHAAGLVHRDIKPSNILTCERGRVCDVAKLLDFGMARAIAPPAHAEEKVTASSSRPLAVKDAAEEPFFLPPQTGESGASGTPHYMSPEQIAGRGKVDPRSDIYSLGATAYFLLTGQPPFANASTTLVLHAHLHQEVPPLTEHRRDIPSDVQEVVLRCLEKDPAKRFSDVIELERALAGCSCAERWTRERAARWWQEYAPVSPIPSSPLERVPKEVYP